ncbi:aminotransferase class IV family protein [Clostridium argentinense CDC 2741]|uniref:Aminotransferase class IV family protein n=1 Tax=Clostridium argentinense CDC 2741 TaxID=1418104 RepID=A0A0C1R1A7_9CLOT|nr:aminotransferase class IV [Clostridium argentinense]ARC85351.1 aminotransferase class IV [Clostridium argentinense]KIE47177.1 aminotransferase class IV family protein [Clostridium argentinense CDC 2741]
MSEVTNKYFIYNGEIKEADQYENIKPTGSKLLYEVIRIIDGKPLFLKEHIERLENSIGLAEQEITINKEGLSKDILELVKVNKVYEGNIKLILDKENIYIFFIKHSYPSEEMYKKGVKTILYFGERENPNAKIINNQFREKVNSEIKSNNAYEAILVDRNGYITEGSRSNIFMIKDEVVLTAPLKDVLPGITRMKIIEACNDLNLKVEEKPISYNEINTLNGLFISGTSPKVLPINSVGDIVVKSQEDKITKKIMDKFNKIIAEDIIKFKIL